MRALVPFAVVVAAALSTAFVPSAREPEPCRVQDKDPNAAATCGQCHKDHYQEWLGRGHAKAWTDPIYQQKLKTMERPESCHACHIPTSVLAKLGKKPGVRKELLDEGVTCVACHKVGDTIHGPFGAKTDAHPSEKDPAFEGEGTVALCASCHGTKIGPVLPLARDYEEAKIASTGKTCVTCHMPEIERHLATSLATGKPTGEKRKSHDHRTLGPGDLEFVKTAFALSVKLDGKDVVVGIENKAGHRVPGLTLRKFVVRSTQVGAEAKELGKEKDLELSSENELKATETRELRFARLDGAKAISIAIDHVFMDKKVATIVEQTLELR